MILSQPILRARDTIVASFSGQKLPSILAFTIILLASTQLGLHFWPDSTLVHGIRIDYLSPVIYFLDVLILAYLVASRTLLNRNSRLQVEKGSPAGERRVLAGKGESLSKLLPPLIKKLDELHITFLEINPFVMDKEQIIPLDMAVEIDSTALSLINQTLPFPLSPVQDFDLSPVESRIRELDAATPAALKFNLLNPAGRIWMLLSGGGASLVLADEVADLGLGSELANYGEYSGAPSTDDTYAYTKLILTQILKTDHNQSQALIIAGGVANFTDVKKTFLGIIQALDEVKAKLVKKNLRIFVRRGGPNEEAGLHLMRDFLEGADLIGSVHGHTSPLTTVVKEAGEYLS